MKNKRDLLLQTATQLFSQGGYNAVGIDRIIAEAGVAKMTMYKHFPSKNALILEMLNARDESFMQSLTQYIDQQSSFFEKMKALFSWHHEWFNDKDFHGCLFINASAEFHQPDNDIYKRSSQHKQRLIHYIENLLTEIYAHQQAKKLAIQIEILLDGAIIAAHVIGHLNSAMEAWDIAQCLIDFKQEN